MPSRRPRNLDAPGVAPARRRAFSLAAGLVIAAAARQARGHAEPFSWVTLWVEATGVRGEITSHIIDAAHEMPGTAPESLLVPAFVARQASAIEAALGERLQ